MSSKKKNKRKQSSHKPRASAVASKRRPHKPSPPRPPASTTATATDRSGRVEPVRSDEARVPPILEPVTFTGVDPAAWKWLNMWPFLDDTAVEAGTDQETEPEAAGGLSATVEPEPLAEPVLVEPDPVADLSSTIDEETPDQVSPLAVFRTWSEEPESSAAPWARLVAGTAALVAAAVWSWAHWRGWRRAAASG